MPKLLSLPKMAISSLPLRRLRLRRIIQVAVLVLLGLFLAEAVRVVVGNNRHWVIENRVMRSAQFSESRLKETIEQFGIKTVINLRGCSYPSDWYVGEIRATSQTNTSQEDITLSAYRHPSPQELNRLIEVLDQSEYPILFHCRRGSDRTGLTAGIVRLLQPNSDVTQAREDCSLRYGHFRFMHTARMDEFFDQYEEWLSRHQEKHTPDRFRSWVRQDYSPGPGSAQLELLGMPEKFRVNQPVKMTLRAKNTSNEVWEFKPGTFAGIHARFSLTNAQGTHVVFDRAGQFEAKVPPGESIDLTIGIPPIHQAGGYILCIDMVVNEQISFVQLGSQPVYRVIRIED